MIDTEINLLSWNVRGFSCKIQGPLKRGRFRNQVSGIHPKPNIIYIQEHKMNQELCEKIGSLGIKRGQGFWNGEILNTETQRYRGGIGIIVTSRIAHTVINSGIIYAGRVQFIICKIDELELGFLTQRDHSL